MRFTRSIGQESLKQEARACFRSPKRPTPLWLEHEAQRPWEIILGDSNDILAMILLADRWRSVTQDSANNM